MSRKNGPHNGFADRMQPSQSIGQNTMGTPTTMTERLALIQELLLENREAQEKGNSILVELRIEVAALQRSHDGQVGQIADMRAEIRQVSDRLRTAEMQIQPMADLRQRNNELESRLRVLEGDGREQRVVTGAIGGGARDIMRLIAAAIIGAVAAGFAGTKMKAVTTAITAVILSVRSGWPLG